MDDEDRHSPERLLEPLTRRESEILALPADTRALLGETAFDIVRKQGRATTLVQAIQETQGICVEIGDAHG